MSEATVGISPDGGGPKVRTVTSTQREADGSYPDTNQQVVTLGDPDGSLVEMGAIADIIVLLKTTNALLRAISVQLSFLNAPRVSIPDLTPFMSDESLQ